MIEIALNKTFVYIWANLLIIGKITISENGNLPIISTEIIFSNIYKYDKHNLLLKNIMNICFGLLLFSINKNIFINFCKYFVTY